MKTLLTGASGFLGSYLIKRLSGEIITLGRSESNTIQCALDREIPILPELDFVIHNAGLAHRIPKTKEEEQSFFSTNLTGTKNLLLALDQLHTSPKAIVFISTVAVYGLEHGEMIQESKLPEPNSPYAKSKFEAECILQDWSKRNSVNLTILRLPLVAGGDHTPGNLGAMIKAIRNGYYRRIGKGEAKKSMVLAEDVAELIPTLISNSGIYNLTDGMNPSMKEFENYLGDFYGKKIKSIPPQLVSMATWIGDRLPGFPINTYRLTKLAQSLTFDDSKAKAELGWRPRSVIGNLDLPN